MNGVMRASDSEGSNHRAAVEMLSTKVIWPSGPALAGTADKTVRRMRSDISLLYSRTCTSRIAVSPQRIVGTRFPSDESIWARRHDREGRMAHRRVGADAKGAADRETDPAVTRRPGFPDGLRSSR